MVLDVAFAEPKPAVPNQTCAAPVDVSEGGRFPGDTVDLSDAHELACATVSGIGDLTYEFTTTELTDVEIAASAITGELMSFAVRSDCDDPETTLRCQSARGARARLHQLPAGTYSIILQGPSFREVDFNLDVAYLPPTPAPPGDSCDAPIELPLNATVEGTLVNRQDLIPTQCGDFYPEAVYRLEVDEPTDLEVHVASSEAAFTFDLQDECGRTETSTLCARAADLPIRIRNVQAGTHFLVVEAPIETVYTLSVATMPRTEPIEAAGNTRCETATEIPPQGGLLTGSTIGGLDNYGASCGQGAANNDAAFRLVLTSTQRVIASLEAPFDTVLYRFSDLSDEGAGVCAARSPFSDSCNDDANNSSNSELDEELVPGTHYYIVDGYSSLENNGVYVLNVQVSDP